MPAPLAVWDVKNASWQRARAAKTAWLRQHDLPADDMYRAEFYLADAPSARIFCYHRNEQGRRHWNDAHDPAAAHDHDSCGLCELPPRDVPLAELPPRDLLYAGA